MWRIVLVVLGVIMFLQAVPVFAGEMGSEEAIQMPALDVNASNADGMDIAISAGIRGFSERNPLLILASLLIVTVATLRRFGSSIPFLVPFLKSDPGGVLLTFLTAATAMLGTAISTGLPINSAVFLAAGKLAVASMGGFAVLWKLVIPLFKWLYGKVFNKQ